ncbi:Fic family protein [Spirosoma soli]|uniref:Fic family protein n=1 Tax=Spirosoma soli TaxID=1770529 RepID=A0ABW5M496_9BACT
MKSVELPPTYLSYNKYFKSFVERGLLDAHAALYKKGVIREINADYLYWDKVKYKVPVEFKHQLTPVDLWSVVKEDRLHDRRYLEIAGEGFYVTSTDSLQQYFHEFDLHLGGSLGNTNSLSDADKHRYLIGSIMEESIASSQIEGAVTSRVVAKDMLRKNRPPRNSSERMIVNNYVTIQHIIKIKDEPLTLDALLSIHRLMTDETLNKPDDAGQFRKHDDIHVIDIVNGEIIHTPPSFTVLPSFADDLCQFFNDKAPDFFLHPVVKASIIHFLIGYFHPFTDGNGRTARALFYWYLLRKGYWLTEYLSISRVIKESRTQYYRAFQYTEVDENDLTYFVLYQVKTLSKAYDELKKYIERKNLEKRQLFALQRDEGLSPRQAQIVEWLQRDPDTGLSAKEIQVRLGVSNQTARFDIQALLEAGYLVELAINRKERSYIRGPRFDKQA